MASPTARPGHGYPAVGFIELTHTVPDAAAAIAVPAGAVKFSVMSVGTVAFQIYGTNKTAAAPTAPSAMVSGVGTAGTATSYSIAVASPVTDINAKDIPCAGFACIWCEGTGGISTVVIRWDLGVT